ncbi:MAG: DUF4197 domain-containing protein [Bacteroidales bacterium]|jgi:hypothetical protein|nr:DUF4197 domain-containing protein [Bacteroidales bacterium]
MKKRIYLLLLSLIVVFLACKDNSGEFVEQLFTNDQINYALGQCCDSTSIRTTNTLCVVDTVYNKLGYYYYDSENYRIDLPSDIKQMKEFVNINIVDTLTKYEYKYLIDSVIYYLNRAAEKCGNEITQFWLTKDINFPNPHTILHGKNSAITDYVKKTQQSEFFSVLVSSVLVQQFNTLDVWSKWNDVLEKYRELTGEPVFSAMGILTSSAQQMVSGYFKIMALEEEAIRKDPSLRGNPNGLLYKVFATL